METTPNLALRLLVQSQSQKELTVNEALCRLDALQAGVISRSLATPPSSPTDGLTYIVGAGATGAWSGKENTIAYYAGGWNFIGPKEGMNLWVKDETILYRYDGSAWVKNTSLTPGSLGLVNLTSPQSGDMLQHTGSQWQNNALPGARRNALLNGSANIWQRGISFSSPAGIYTADRFISETGTGGASTVSRQNFTLGQADVPNEPTYFLRHQQTTAASSAPALSQRIENVRSFAGRNAVISFYAKASATLTITPSLIQSFGTGGSPSSSVTQTLSTRTISTSWSRIVIPVSVASISGKTLGTNGDDYLQLRLALPTGSSFTFDIAQMQMEAGTIATAFEQLPMETELLACQRYFTKTFPVNIAPASAAGRSGAMAAVAASNGFYSLTFNWRFNVEMRATPTITTYNPDAAGNDIRNIITGTNIAVTTGASSSGAYIVNNANSTDGTLHYVHATANAEL